MAGLEVAAIIAVGSELLTPSRRDTNSAWLTSRLNELGVEVRSRTIAPDDLLDLAAAVRGALGRVDLLILTGGLGPTADDLTREVVAGVVGRPLVQDDRVLEGIRERFARRGVEMPAVNLKQALVPAGAVVLPNGAGTAPGLWIEVGAQTLVLLPGPPRELEPMFEALVAPRIAARTGGRRLRRRVVSVTGLSESQVEQIAQPIYGPLAGGPQPITTSILATPGRIELHLSAWGSDVDAIDRTLEAAVLELGTAIGPAVFSTDDSRLEQVIAAELSRQKLQLAVAESCTGGLLMGRLTDVPGSSAWLLGGLVAYDNRIKIEALGVTDALIAAHGAVSEPVAQAMAAGVRTRFGADLAVAITGIAGPTGGTPDKPVGTVVIAIDAAVPVVRTLRFAGTRPIVRELAVAAALEMLRRSVCPGARGPAAG
ncbi:MAG TPA: competence/damage-inducible protein A [Vicinamibacterales bacterium]|nr:competence/damage-inducible protein A [Vicinamibacterales bacterium]